MLATPSRCESLLRWVDYALKNIQAQAQKNTGRLLMRIRSLIWATKNRLGGRFVLLDAFALFVDDFPDDDAMLIT